MLPYSAYEYRPKFPTGPAYVQGIAEVLKELGNWGDRNREREMERQAQESNEALQKAGLHQQWVDSYTSNQMAEDELAQRKAENEAARALKEREMGFEERKYAEGAAGRAADLAYAEAQTYRAMHPIVGGGGGEGGGGSFDPTREKRILQVLENYQSASPELRDDAALVGVLSDPARYAQTETAIAATTTKAEAQAVLQRILDDPAVSPAEQEVYYYTLTPDVMAKPEAAVAPAEESAGYSPAGWMSGVGRGAQWVSRSVGYPLESTAYGLLDLFTTSPEEKRRKLEREALIRVGGGGGGGIR